MSDLHGYLPNPKEIDYLMGGVDVICITGDIVPLAYQDDTLESIAWLYTKFFPWVESLPCQHVVFCWGNHDFVGEFLRVDKNGNHRKAKRVAKKMMFPSKLHLVEDSEFIYKGYKFYGSSWCPDLQWWAFYRNSEDLTKAFKKIPDDVDVLLTHCPPRVEMYGTVNAFNFNLGPDFGCVELAEAVNEKKPRLHIFGHVHTGSHRLKQIGDTSFCNVSLLDEEYQLVYPPAIFSLDDEKVEDVTIPQTPET